MSTRAARTGSPCESDATVLEEAYERLQVTGPEFEGWLSNHGPMVVEAMTRHGHSSVVGRWLDMYTQRLEDSPRPGTPIGEDWQSALGEATRIGDWTVYFERCAADISWRELLNLWWPRLLPGVVAAATHGVIRVGHAVRALRAGAPDGTKDPSIRELAHGLAYWAARFQPVPGTGQGTLLTDPSAGTGAGLDDALRALPRLTPQEGGIRERLGRLVQFPDWPRALTAARVPSAPDDVTPWLDALVDAAVRRYLWYGHGNSIMLVHSATAPNAIARALPVLDPALWVQSAAAAWAAVAALTAAYAPGAPATPQLLPEPPAGAAAAEDTFARAVEHGDEHVIKFADTALDAYERTGDSAMLAAAVRACTMIEPSPY